MENTYFSVVVIVGFGLKLLYCAGTPASNRGSLTSAT